jgi:hypothetical protein
MHQGSDKFRRGIEPEEMHRQGGHRVPDQGSHKKWKLPRPRCAPLDSGTLCAIQRRPGPWRTAHAAATPKRASAGWPC